MSYYISKLECKNIGVFNNLTIEFSSRCNVLIGPNGAGKTSILKLICLSLIQNYMNKIRFRKGASLVLNTFEDNTTIAYGGFDLADKDQSINNFSFSPYIQPLRSDLADVVINFGQNQSSYKLLAIGAHRYFNYKQITGMQREEKGIQRLNSYLFNNLDSLDNPSLPEIKQWMINRYFVIDKDWANVERENWQYLLEYIPKLSPEKTKIAFVKIERDLEPVFAINGRECYLEELSSGFKSILSIVFSIVDWIEGVNEGNDAKINNAQGTVLIDEIDVHLHPQWQQLVLDMLKSLFAKLQFIVTAHSPLVVSSAQINEIIVIPENSGELVLSPQKRMFKAWSPEEIMSNLMGFTPIENDQVNDILDSLDQAIENGDLDSFEQNYEQLKESLSPDDAIIVRYGIRKSELFINRKK
ncbi:AAA family ATPase [Pedobacter panaciterrae]